MTKSTLLYANEEVGATLAILMAIFGRFHPGRFFTATVTSVDEVNRTVSASANGGTVRAPYVGATPLVGSVWRFYAKQGGSYFADDVVH